MTCLLSGKTRVGFSDLKMKNDDFSTAMLVPRPSISQGDHVQCRSESFQVRNITGSAIGLFSLVFLLTNSMNPVAGGLLHESGTRKSCSAGPGSASFFYVCFCELLGVLKI